MDWGTWESEVSIRRFQLGTEHLLSGRLAACLPVLYCAVRVLCWVGCLVLVQDKEERGREIKKQSMYVCSACLLLVGAAADAAGFCSLMETHKCGLLLGPGQVGTNWVE